MGCDIREGIDGEETSIESLFPFPIELESEKLFLLLSFGNSFVLLWTVVLPFVSTLFGSTR